MKIITFYSYKGGVGRTMCLANIAVLLAKWGHKVLMVDWDWEAPGLERYFVSENFNGKTNGKTSTTPAGIDLSIVKEKPGLVDLLTERKKDGWKEAVIQIPIPDAREPLHFISAGRRDDDYFKRVRDFNVDTFYAKKKGGQFIEDLRRAWRDTYDFILIDSRTGVSEINGISTIQMPNLVVLLFTATNQSFEGALDIAYRSASAHQKLPYDRGQLLFLPLLSRVEVAVGHLTDQWIARFSKDLEPLYQPWLPMENPNIKINEFMMRTKIPHDPYYTFGEELAVVRDGTVDPARMGYAYEGIASLIANKLERVEEFVERRETFVKGVGGSESPIALRIVDMIKDDRLKDALTLLENYFRVENKRNHLHQVVAMSRNLSIIQRGYSRGQLLFSDWAREENRIVQEMLEMTHAMTDDFAVSIKPVIKADKKVFISYNHTDSAVARQVCTYLENNGVDVILDQDDMAAGRSILEFIQDSTKNADAVVSILSSKSLQSGWVGQENVASIYAAWLADKKFIPVKLDDIAFDIDFQISTTEALATKIKDLKEKIKKLESLDGDARGPREDLSRIVEMKANLSKITQRLTSNLMLDISGSDFEPNMRRVLAAIQ